MFARNEILVQVGRLHNKFFVTEFPNSRGLPRTLFLLLLLAEELCVRAAFDFSVLIAQHVLRSQPFAPLVFRFPPFALHIEFGQHEFLGSSSPDTYLRIPPHPGSWRLEHVTDIPGLRFGTVDFL